MTFMCFSLARRSKPRVMLTCSVPVVTFHSNRVDFERYTFEILEQKPPTLEPRAPCFRTIEVHMERGPVVIP